MTIILNIIFDSLKFFFKVRIIHVFISDFVQSLIFTQRLMLYMTFRHFFEIIPKVFLFLAVFIIIFFIFFFIFFYFWFVVRMSPRNFLFLIIFFFLSNLILLSVFLAFFIIFGAEIFFNFLFKFKIF